MSDKAKTIINDAIDAIHKREFWAAYPEHPKAYGEGASEKGLEHFKSMLNAPFTMLKQKGADKFVGEEVSPYTRQSLGIKYPTFEADTLIIRAGRARSQWVEASVDDRAEVLHDALERIKEKFFEIAYATMHTTGQSFMMSFQASGPHSNDRALEAMALGYQELKRFPEKVRWNKPMGKFNIEVDKSYKPVPRGIALAIGCSTFPVWNSVPGIFASLITGNPVIVKPHAKSVLPIAIVVAEMQAAFEAKGFDPNTVQLAVDTLENPLTVDLMENPAVKIIDYTGSSSFGDIVEALVDKVTFTEKAGVNSVIIDSTNNLQAMTQNLAFALSLYSGQMCTAPQNIFIPEEGIQTDKGHVPFEDVVKSIKDSVNALSGNPKMGAGTLGALQTDATMKRMEAARGMSDVIVVDAAKVDNKEFPDARTCSPVVLSLDSKDREIYSSEMFGPIAFVIKTKDTKESIEKARELAAREGAITCAAYTTDADTAKLIEQEMESAFTPVSFNFTGFLWVNQHAAFSDFHVTGGNPAGNASFTNPEYVNKRFVWVGHRHFIDPMV